LTRTEWWHYSLMSVLLLHCAPCLQIYPNFAIFNLVFLSEMLSRERKREIYSVSSTLTYPVTYTSKNPVVWLYAFFWVIPRRVNFICWRFGTLCSIFMGR